MFIFGAISDTFDGIYVSGSTLLDPYTLAYHQAVPDLALEALKRTSLTSSRKTTYSPRCVRLTSLHMDLQSRGVRQFQCLAPSLIVPY